MQQSNFDPENFIGPRVPQNPDFQGENFIGPRVPQNPLDFGTVQRGTSKTLQETLTNPNNGTLIWNVSITYSAGWTGWLALNTSGGTIPVNGNQDLSVTANTGALTPGTYAATLTFSGNFSPNEQVAVNLVVQ
jgi:hypothetical protein